MADKSIDNIIDCIGDLALIVSLIPGCTLVGAAHLPFKYGKRILKKLGIIKEDIPKEISEEFEAIISDTLKATCEKIYTGDYKEFLLDSVERFKHKSSNLNPNDLSFEEQDKLMRKCMKESISAGGYYITPKDIRDFNEKVDREYAYQLFQHPNYGVFSNYITGKEHNRRLSEIEKYIEEFKSWNVDTSHKITLHPIVKGNSKLIGREEDIKEINKLLKSNQPVVLVNGIGGVGKSALCKHYCTNHDGEIGWFDYEESLENTLLKIADSSKLGNEAGRQSEFIKVKEYLNNLPNDTILAFDNVSKQVQEEVDFLCSLNCKVIITSRQTFKAYSKVFKKHELVFLSTEACMEMFAYYCDDKEEVDVKDKCLEKIVECAGYHTLTIELLARIYDTASRIKTLQDLLNLLDEKGFNLTNKISASGKIEEKEFIEHLHLLFDISDIQDEDMIHALKNLCILPSIPVDEDKILDWIGDEYEDALHKLINTGWIKKEDGKITMHNVVCETLKIKLIPTYVDCKTLIGGLTKEIYYKYEIEKYNAPYFTQCLDVANYFKTNAIKGEKLGYLYNNIGNRLYDIAKNNEAITWFLKSIEIKEKVLGTEHPFTATTYNNIALVYEAKGDYEEALRYYKKDLAICEKTLGTEHPNTSTSYNNIALVYYAKGECDKALDYFNKALKICIDTFGAYHPYLASTYNNIAVVYQNKGDYDEALKYYNKALIIREKVLGKEHPDTATSYNNISITYYYKKEFEQALDMMFMALYILLEVLGKNHPHTQSSFINLKEIYKASGRHMEEFEEWFNEHFEGGKLVLQSSDN